MAIEDGILSVSRLDGSNGFTIRGAVTDVWFGSSVAFAGDVNGDGHEDLVIGASHADPAGRNEAGATHVIYGRNMWAPTSVADDLAGFSVIGATRGDRLGTSVAEVGDVNADGYDDLLVGGAGATVSDPDEGYLIYGVAAASTRVIDIGDMDGLRLPSSTILPGAGEVASGVGDLDGDGSPDFALSDPFASVAGNASSGIVHVFYGEDAGFTFVANDAYKYAGEDVAGLGDINGDGFDDLAISVSNGALGGVARHGVVHIIYGGEDRLSGVISAEDLNGVHGTIVRGGSRSDRVGYSISSAGDVNGDGVADFILEGAGQSEAGEQITSAYVVYGDRDGFGSEIDVRELDGSNGFTVTGTGNRGYVRVTGGGDFNGDGYDDVIVTDSLTDGNGAAGSAYVVFGRPTGQIETIDVASLSGENGFRIDGGASSDFLGEAVAFGADLNADGLDDIVLGSRGAGNRGKAYVIFGADVGAHEEIRATDGPDALFGTAGADAFDGGAGNDRLHGRAGDDVLIGGTGADVLVANEISTGAQSAQVFRLYETAFARAPDEAGFEGWVAAFAGGTSLEAAAATFVASPEFQQTYGSLSTGEFVELLYDNALGRAPDANGRAGWVALLDAGTLTRAQVVVSFSESAEQVGRTELAAQGFINGTVLEEHAGQVFRMYDTAFNRAPDADGFDGWLGALDAGTSVSALADAFIGSAEFQLRYGDLSTGDFVEQLYLNVLDRASDPDGKANWTSAIDSGAFSRAQVVVGFSESAEHVGQTNPALDAYVTVTLDRDTLIDGGADDDIMVGGRGADVFRITAGGGTTSVMGADRFDALELSGFTVADAENFRAGFTDVGGDLVNGNAGHTLILPDTDLATFAEMDIVLA